jgi:hypothetical protein
LVVVEVVLLGMMGQVMVRALAVAKVPSVELVHLLLQTGGVGQGQEVVVVRVPHQVVIST